MDHEDLDDVASSENSSPSSSASNRSLNTSRDVDNLPSDPAKLRTLLRAMRAGANAYKEESVRLKELLKKRDHEISELRQILSLKNGRTPHPITRHLLPLLHCQAVRLEEKVRGLEEELRSCQAGKHSPVVAELLVVTPFLAAFAKSKMDVDKLRARVHTHEYVNKDKREGLQSLMQEIQHSKLLLVELTSSLSSELKPSMETRLAWLELDTVRKEKQEAEEQFFQQFASMLEQNSALERELHQCRDMLRKEQMADKASMESFVRGSSEILVGTELRLNSICDCLEMLGEKFASLGYDRTLMISALGKLTGLQQSESVKELCEKATSMTEERSFPLHLHPVPSTPRSSSAVIVAPSYSDTKRFPLASPRSQAAELFDGHARSPRAAPQSPRRADHANRLQLEIGRLQERLRQSEVAREEEEQKCKAQVATLKNQLQIKNEIHALVKMSNKNMQVEQWKRKFTELEEERRIVAEHQDENKKILAEVEEALRPARDVHVPLRRTSVPRSKPAGPC
ncbi:hypothetical protein GUITHDRAFT_138193 [Guillardia theta CCMP2712]|uniref:Uncharacterized protein n=1 Tax=Guillardia theta (strain CCMP2712) TaxID=905079 RepID=L1JDR8_GUITC|nr:hypothetical protein GUITHDRAFT_138193 [Guillardia theta CCMP2712]EKX46447.1 hypothetical protein GUITHDRAFT_138193 [Guillardia theta CCMP2712]|eukprot:XP_005833427.1 hypothetical protein GUITHDRAFT_138193 [Guillardia theta CCMP2712]